MSEGVQSIRFASVSITTVVCALSIDFYPALDYSRQLTTFVETQTNKIKKQSLRFASAEQVEQVHVQVTRIRIQRLDNKAKRDECCMNSVSSPFVFVLFVCFFSIVLGLWVLFENRSMPLYSLL